MEKCEFNLKNQKHRVFSAFTVVEILVVLAVAAILAGATVPVITKFLPGIRLDGTTRTLIGDLRDAQQRAVSSQNKYIIRFFPTNSPPKYQLIQIIIHDELTMNEKSSLPAKTLFLDSNIFSIPKNIIGKTLAKKPKTSESSDKIAFVTEESILREEIFSTGETLTLDSTVTDNQIIFSPDGGATGSGNIELTLDSRSKTINVSPAGFIKIQ